jgi:hypothetical protein
VKRIGNPRWAVRWDRVPVAFARLSSSVTRLVASDWKSAGARFASNADPDFPIDVATGVARTPLGAVPFSVVDEGHVTTIETSTGLEPHALRGAAVLLALVSAEVIDPSKDLLQERIGPEC